MKSADCLTVSPGEPLTDWQKLGLDLVARWQGRDVNARASVKLFAIV